MSLHTGPHRRLGVLGAVLLTCSVLVPVVFAVVVLDGADAKPETYVAGGGVAQKVEVPEGRAMMIWLDESVTPSDCLVQDANGDTVALAEVSDSPRQSAGTAGDWVGTYRFEVAGDSARVTCDGVGQPPMGALVTPAPGLLAGLSGVAVLAAIALTLLVGGLYCLARAGVGRQSLVV